MHELPAASWVLIVCSTVPWLIVTLIHYVRHRTDGASDRDAVDDG